MKDHIIKNKSIMKLKENQLSTKEAAQARGGKERINIGYGQHRSYYSPPPRWDVQNSYGY